MTTLSSTTSSSPALALSANGVRIPKRGTIACHPALGYGEVVSRSGSRLRIKIDCADADVFQTLRERSAARTAGAEIEIAGLEREAQDILSPLNGAKALLDGMIESIIGRTTSAGEVIVSIDNAEKLGWEFDEYALAPVKKAKAKKVAAPKPVVAQPVEVVELEDSTRPDWLVAEMNACFGDTWTPGQAQS